MSWDQNIDLIYMVKLWVNGPYYDWPKYQPGLFDGSE